MKILIIDDHPLFLKGISPLLEKLASNVELLTAPTSHSALKLMKGHDDLDLVLLDLNLPDSNGFSLLQASRERLTEAPFVILTASTRLADMQSALSKGAKGYICKSATPEVVLGALSLVMAGGIYIPPEMVQDNRTGSFQQLENVRSESRVSRKIQLTPRQTQVLTLLVDGKGRSNKEIANLVGCREATVKVHVTALLKAMDVGNRVQLQTAAYELGILQKERRSSEITG